MTLKVIRQFQAFSSAIHRTFVQYFTRFQLTAHCAVPQRQLGFLYGNDDLQVIRAETLLASAVVEHNLPIAFPVHFGPLLKHMCPYSKIAQKFSCIVFESKLMNIYYSAYNLVFKIALLMQLLSIFE